MLRSLATWRDLTDGHLYHEGDIFPFDGRVIAAERLAELKSGRNRAGLRLIEGIETKNEPKEVQQEKAPEKAAEGRKTAPRKRTTKK